MNDPADSRSVRESDESSADGNGCGGPAYGTRRIFIRGLTLPARIGVRPHERAAHQMLRIDLSADVVMRSLRPERIDDVVCYETLAGRIRDVLRRRHVDLMETLADELAADVLSDERVRRIEIRLEKPNAIRDAEAAGVLVRREADPRAADPLARDAKATADLRRIRDIIRAAGSAGVTKARLTRASQWLHAQDRDDVLHALVENGDVVSVDTGHGNRRATLLLAVAKPGNA